MAPSGDPLNNQGVPTGGAQKATLQTLSTGEGASTDDGGSSYRPDRTNSRQGTIHQGLSATYAADFFLRRSGFFLRGDDSDENTSWYTATPPSAPSASAYSEQSFFAFDHRNPKCPKKQPIWRGNCAEVTCARPWLMQLTHDACGVRHAQLVSWKS